jgi:hypothetical protein
VIEFINEPVSVELQRRQDETGRPMAFVWRGQRFQVESWGRESTKRQADQTMHCYLVQTAGSETWELCRDAKTAQWMLTRHWTRQYRVV